MFDILEEVNRLTLLYKIKHLSKFMKSIGIIYFIFAIAFSLFILSSYNSEFEQNTSFIYLFVLFLDSLFIGAFLISVSKDNYFHSYYDDEYANDDYLHDIEYNFMMKLELDKYIGMKHVLHAIIKDLKDDSIISSDEVIEYVRFLKGRLDYLDDYEKWFLNIYAKTVAEKKVACLRLSNI